MPALARRPVALRARRPVAVLARRPLGLLAAVAAGAAVALGVMLVSGGDASVVWVAVAGGAACACGLVVGSTARVLPAMVLAMLAAAALVLAVQGAEDDEPVPAFDSVETPRE